MVIGSLPAMLRAPASVFSRETMKEMQPDRARVRIPQLLAKKQRGDKITMLTAYDATMARLLDRAGIDVLLVGDSLGTVILGSDTTLTVTLEAVIHHTRAVSRGAGRALVVADMPFLTYQVDIPDAVRNAGRLLQEGGAAAVKLEGGLAVADTIRRLVSLGIPVMGHVGLTPQSVHQLGGFRAVGKTQNEAAALIDDARAVQHAGAFAVVLESVPAEIAEAITKELTIPTIGIGAGPACDGQVLVSYDAFGIFDAFVPRFVKQYARLGDEIVDAAKKYIADVREARFPAPEHSIYIHEKPTETRSRGAE
jgi:3-methyl-2-oxobutanoate hydroxymethyltransferase